MDRPEAFSGWGGDQDSPKPRGRRRSSRASAGSSSLSSANSVGSLASILDPVEVKDLGTLFCTRAKVPSKSKGTRGCVHDAYREAVDPDVDAPAGLSPAVRMSESFLRVSALVSCGYVLGALALEPICVGSSAGPAIVRFGESQWWVVSSLNLGHLLNALAYVALAFFCTPAPAPPEVGRRLRTLGLWCDATSLVGLLAELIHMVEPSSGLPGSVAQWGMLVHTIKLWRFVLPEKEATASVHGFTARVVRIFVKIFYAAHLMSTLLLIIGNLEAAHSSLAWWEELRDGGSTCRELYSEAGYYAVLTLTTVGDNEFLVTSWERNVNSLLLILAQLFAATVCAEYIWLKSIYNHQEAQHEDRKAQTWVAMRRMNVPVPLAERVVAFQAYVAKMNREDLGQPEFAGLSGNLKMEVQLNVYRALVLQAPFLRIQPKEVISLIVSALRDRTYLPQDFIVRAGEKGRELFFLRRGEAGVFLGMEVPDPWKQEEVVSYAIGSYFGEIGMLAGKPRSAWIMAKSYCVCSVLPTSAVEQLSEEHPGAFTTMVQTTVRSYKLESKTSWRDVSKRLVAKYSFDDIDKAFAWFCSLGGTWEDEELRAKAFDEGLRRLKVPELDRKIMWADMDEDNDGSVTLGKFQRKVDLDEVWGGTMAPSCASTPGRTCSRNRMMMSFHPSMHNFRRIDASPGGCAERDVADAARAAARRARDPLARGIEAQIFEIRHELAARREQNRLLGEEIALLQSDRSCSAAGLLASQSLQMSPMPSLQISAMPSLQ